MSIRKQGEFKPKTTPTKPQETPTTTTVAPFLHVPGDGDDMKGPSGNPNVNWVLKPSPEHTGGLLVGSFPREKILDDALSVGASVFICLTTHKELDRAGGSYLNKLQRIVSKTDAKLAAALEWIHVPIFDQQIAEDKIADELSSRIVSLIASGKIVYMHCMGGHGRTGTIASLVIAKACGVSGLDALEVCRKVHAQRGQCMESPGTFESPETHEQRDQVFRIIDKKKK